MCDPYPQSDEINEIDNPELFCFCGALLDTDGWCPFCDADTESDDNE